MLRLFTRRLQEVAEAITLEHLSSPSDHSLPKSWQKMVDQIRQRAYNHPINGHCAGKRREQYEAWYDA